MFDPSNSQMLGEGPGAADLYQQATTKNLAAADIADQAAKRWRLVTFFIVTATVFTAFQMDRKRR
jgi:hypothetical protein